MDAPAREGVPIIGSQQVECCLGGFDDGMAMSFGTNGVGSFNASSLDSGPSGCSPRSIGGFFSTRTDSGYASKDTTSNDTSSGASQPQAIQIPVSEGIGMPTLSGSCEMQGSSPSHAQRYKAERTGQFGHSANSQRMGSSFGKEAVFGSLSPNMLASLDAGPFGGMDMDL